MVQRKGRSRRGTRYKLKKSCREKGKLSLVKFFQEFKQGDKVVLKANSAYQKGAYHYRFHGSAGQVTGQQGACYTVAINNKGKEKSLIVHPVHLVKQ